MIRAFFWTAAAIIAYTYVGYPIYIYLRSRLQPKMWLRTEIYPKISIVMAVHNGADLLQKKIEYLLNLDYPHELTEVIVVSDGSTDTTNKVLATFAHPRLHSVICSNQQGKAVALNGGIGLATGEILVFTDLRQRFEPGAVAQLISNFADPAVGCATGELQLKHLDSGTVTGAVGGLYWRYEQSIRKCEGLVDSVLGVSGAFYAVRRELVTEFPAGLILDDMYRPLTVVRQGYRAILDPEARFRDTLPQRPGGEFERKVRTLVGNYQLLQLAPWVLCSENPLRSRLISHKLLRLQVPLLLFFVLITSFLLRASSFYFGLFAVQIVFAATALLQPLQLPAIKRIAAPLAAFYLLNAAALVALLRFFFHRGPLWKTWGPTLARVTETVPEATSATVSPESIFGGRLQ